VEEVPESAERFVSSRPGVEAAVMPIGIHSHQVVLVAPSGEWLRFVLDTAEEARKLCVRLEVEPHDGYPEHLRQRMGAWQRTPEDWAAAPYPERTRNTST
jgi:sugar phosphate isomerase/epimerase